MIEICFVLVNNKDSFVVNNIKIAPLYRKDINVNIKANVNYEFVFRYNLIDYIQMKFFITNKLF